MSQAKMHRMNDRGKYEVTCEPCDASAEFLDIGMAVHARNYHLCEGEVPSCRPYGRVR